VRPVALSHNDVRDAIAVQIGESRAMKFGERDIAGVAGGEIPHDRVLDERLNVMDATAIVMCRENNLPLRVFNLFHAGDLVRIVQGEDVGTVVSAGP